MKILRKIIQIDEELCNGCGQCLPGCAEGALQLVDGKARLVAEKYCDGLGACLGECPVGALRVVEKEADDFDEAAVEKHLHETKAAPQTTAARVCPSGIPKTLNHTSPCQAANAPQARPGAGASDLGNWPVQIRLVPPDAPFLQNADLLVAADCVPFAFSDFHREFLRNRVVMAGCPKFDDTEGYIRKFAEIFKTARIKSVLLVIMEVPCCAYMRTIIREALSRAGRKIPVEEAVLSARGAIIKRGLLDF